MSIGSVLWWGPSCCSVLCVSSENKSPVIFFFFYQMAVNTGLKMLRELKVEDLIWNQFVPIL